MYFLWLIFMNNFIQSGVQFQDPGREGKNRRRKGNNYNKGFLNFFFFVKTVREHMTNLMTWPCRKNHWKPSIRKTLSDSEEMFWWEHIDFFSLLWPACLFVTFHAMLLPCTVRGAGGSCQRSLFLFEPNYTVIQFLTSRQLSLQPAQFSKEMSP